MNHPGGGGRPSEPPQSRGMNDVFVTDIGFRPSGPRFDEFGSGGMPTDRAAFGLRYLFCFVLPGLLSCYSNNKVRKQGFQLTNGCQRLVENSFGTVCFKFIFFSQI